MASPFDVTATLQDRAPGERPDVDRMYPHVYDMLRDMAQKHLARTDSLYLRAYTLAQANLLEQPPHILTTLNGLALVHKTLGNHASADTLYPTVLQEQTDALSTEHRNEVLGFEGGVHFEDNIL